MDEAEDPDREPTKREWVGFWSMIVQQTQNAFNDKAAQFILIPLGGAVGASVFGIGIETIAGALIALPFILFAPITGWLSDRFSKRNVMLGAAFAQLAILAWLFMAIQMRNMTLALMGFFALAVQSAFFSPAKIGINKELVGSRHLGFAAGIQQMMAMIAILAGQIGAGIYFDHRYQALGGTPDQAWPAGSLALLILAALGVPAILMAWIVPKTPAQGAEPLRPGVAVQHFKHLTDLWSDRSMRRGSFGIAFFWGFAALINIWSIKVAKALTDGGEGFGSLQAYFMVAATLGMILGFGVASFLLRKRIELGWVPIAGVALTVSSIALAFVDPRTSRALIDPVLAATLIDGAATPIAAVLHPSTGLFLWGLAAIAFFAALFLAPLNAWMQDRYPPAKRGELQAAVNLQDCLAGILALVFVEGFAAALAGTSLGTIRILQWELVAAGLFSGLITWFIIRLVPSHLVRVIGLSLLGIFYRIRAVNPENLPKKGGVLLLPNHVSWADAFFLTAASPRPVRFVMDATYMQYAPIRWFCRLFNTVPINLGKPREALRTAGEALAGGDVVCLFPEGQLTRTGTLQELKRGFELIARKGGAPVVPVWQDGAWGSIFSFERNRFFRKWPRKLPYGLSIAFGRPLDPREARLDHIRHGMLGASVEAMRYHLGHERWTNRMPRQESRFRPHFEDAEKRPRLWANGYQLGQVNAIPRGVPIAHLDDDPALDGLGGLAAFGEIFRGGLHVHTGPAKARDRHWAGGAKLRELLEADPPPEGGGIFFDFEPGSEPLECEGWVHCPCLAIGGIIVAMSFPDPPAPLPTSRPQPGRRPGTRGLLLPGFVLDEENSRIFGPAAPDGGLALPPGTTLDELGFVCLATEAH